MKLVVELRNADGDVIHKHVEPGTVMTVHGGFTFAESMKVTVDGIDDFLVEHLDEIVGVAAMAVAWRNEQRKPHPDRASQVASLKEFMRYSAVLDTISDDVRGWLMMRKPRTELKVMEGG